MSQTSSLRQVGPSVVDEDPYWAAVVARHPSSTYVLLPPDPARPEIPPDQAGAATAAVAATWRLLQGYVEAAGSTDTPAVSWRGSPGARRLVSRIALAGIGRESGVDLAARVGADLGERGWTLRPRRGADVSSLTARAPGGGHPVEVEVSAGDGATVLSVMADAVVA